MRWKGKKKQGKNIFSLFYLPLFMFSWACSMLLDSARKNCGIYWKCGDGSRVREHRRQRHQWVVDSVAEFLVLFRHFVFPGNASCKEGIKQKEKRRNNIGDVLFVRAFLWQPAHSPCFWASKEEKLWKIRSLSVRDTFMRRMYQRLRQKFLQSFFSRFLPLSFTFQVIHISR